MNFTKAILALSAAVAASPALADPGHMADSAGHIHWEFVGAGIMVVCAVFAYRRQKAAAKLK